MKRDLEKRLEQLEIAVASVRSRPSLRNVTRRTAAELEAELMAEMKKDQEEYEQRIESPEHKRLLLEDSIDGHKYRKSFFKSARYLRAKLLEEIGEETLSEQERVAAMKAYAEECRLKREGKVEAVGTPRSAEPIGWSDDHE